MMDMDTPGTHSIDSPLQPVAERSAGRAAGLPMLCLSLITVAGGTWVVQLGSAAAKQAGASGSRTGATLAILGGVLLIVLGALGLRGLIAVGPGQARVVQLFGRYTGTVRAPGLQWVNPFTTRRTVSTRIRNHETPVLKVNDADGNPIEMAAVVVWQVRDTARATFAVNDFAEFVAIQAETAVRHIGTSYPYDSRDKEHLSLRENAEAITQQLSAEIADRVVSAGVAVIESRLTRLAYAPEIAQAMLRRQQAEAVVAARQRIVEGAVGMVHLALGRLAEEAVVDLDEERKAAMVSNLLVVLCSEHATQPVVNTGSLYQ
jgi:regulator of protease activity HflC (stomatin/prohibitin superfamily)